MNKLLIAMVMAAFLAASIPVSQADETKFGTVAPRAEYGRYQHPGDYDRRDRRYQNRSNRHYRTNRANSYSRYRYRPNSDYAYRPFPAPLHYTHHNRRDYHRYWYDPVFRNYYHHRGDGIRISPYGLTIFIDLDD